MENDPIILTLAAEEYISEVIEKDPSKSFKISINTKGCAGNSYQYTLVDNTEIQKSDSIIERSWGKVIIDAASLLHVIGSTLNLKEDMFSAELVWYNPNASSTCGCGKSFSSDSGCSK